VRDRLVAHTTQSKPTHSNASRFIDRSAQLLEKATSVLLIAVIAVAGLAVLAVMSLIGWAYGVWQNRNFRGMP